MSAIATKVFEWRITLPIVRRQQTRSAFWATTDNRTVRWCVRGQIGDQAKELERRRRREMDGLKRIEPERPATGTDIDVDGRTEDGLDGQAQHRSVAPGTLNRLRHRWRNVHNVG